MELERNEAGRIVAGQTVIPPQVTWTGVANANEVGGHEVRVVSELRTVEDDGERLFVAWEHSPEEWRGDKDALGIKQWTQGLVLASTPEFVVKGLVMGIVDIVGLPSVGPSLIAGFPIDVMNHEVLLSRRINVVEDGKLIEAKHKKGQ